jgi:hypothetical protein
MSEFAGARPDEPIETRLARLEDIDAVTRLKARYAQLHDAGYNGDAVVELFVEDGVWTSPQSGSYEGREAIREMINGVGESTRGLFASHLMLNPDVTIAEDGQSARGRWYLLELLTLRGVEDPDKLDSVVVSANYTDDFVKVDGRWYFKQVSVVFHHVSNLDPGWAAEPFRS